MRTGPSPHVSWVELRCHDGAAYPLLWRGDRAKKLAAVFEAIRAIWDMPIPILSAYRTATYNAAVGGAPNSQHVQGLALDLAPPAGVDVTTFHRLIRVRALSGGGVFSLVGAVGVYSWGSHVDLRPRAQASRITEWDLRAEE